MTVKRYINSKWLGRGRRLLTLVMVLAMLITTVPQGFAATSVGSSSGNLVDSTIKSFIQVPAAGATFFTGETSGTGTVVTVPAGSVWMLVTEDYYTVDSVNYYGVYYDNKVHHVRCQDVVLMTTADVQTYIKNNVWGASNYTTLKMPLNLRGDVRVYGLQLALQSLGYYKDNLDGNYGQATDDAVYKFQRANGLSKDGDAGPITQAALYAQVNGSGSAGGSTSGSTSSGTTTAPSTTGTLRTKVSVNLREKASKESPKLATVPLNTNLTYYSTYESGGVVWYQVIYNNLNGWLMGTYVNASGAGSGSGVGTLTTIDSVNLRKSTSTSSTRLGVVPQGVTLAYSDAKTSGGVTWYKVVYGVNTGWVMGTYVNAGGGSGSGSSSGSSGNQNYTIVGSLRITKTSTRVRNAPNGNKTGIVLAKGSTVSLIGAETAGGTYTWYPVVTSNGTRGYVRSDCAEVITNGSNGGSGSGNGSGSGAGSVTVSTTVKFINIPANTAAYKSAGGGSAALTIPKGSVVRMVTGDTVSGSNGATYCQIYFNGTIYYVLYSDVSAGVMSDAALASYVLTLWDAPLNDKFYNDGTLHGDVRVYAAQLALYALGYYTGNLDGTYGNETAAAVKNFQRAQKIGADGVIGVQTWPVLCNMAKQISDGSTTVKPGGSGSTSGGTSAVVTDFGTVNKVTKPTWDEADNGNYWPKYTFATVLDITTGKVFTIYRTGGSNHPDAVPYTTNDTRTMCEIVGFTYPGRTPTSAELKKIVNDSPNSNSTYTWPDFKGTLTGVKAIGSAWDRRPALLNVNGNVYAVSIYGWPHGFEGIGAKDGLSTQKFPNGKLLYENNNFYGCMCIRFYNSKGHGSANQTVINEHNAACNKAYDYAKKKWPGLCK
ncbi:MAG: hypothetical protein E7331_01665 [Clostridiales bacterium]|nr:hypothetical protein [Clostridiales bacterium]